MNKTFCDLCKDEILENEKAVRLDMQEGEVANHLPMRPISPMDYIKKQQGHARATIEICMKCLSSRTVNLAMLLKQYGQPCLAHLNTQIG